MMILNTLYLHIMFLIEKKEFHNIRNDSKGSVKLLFITEDNKLNDKLVNRRTQQLFLECLLFRSASVPTYLTFKVINLPQTFTLNDLWTIKS